MDQHEDDSELPGAEHARLANDGSVVVGRLSSWGAYVKYGSPKGIIIRGNEIITRGKEIIIRGNEIIFRRNKIAIVTTYFLPMSL